MTEAKVAYWVERAAAHQCRALRFLRAVRGADEGLLGSPQTLIRQSRALQSLLAARRAVLRAQTLASGTEQSSTLQEHVTQLDALIQAVQRECSETEGRRVARFAPLSRRGPA